MIEAASSSPTCLAKVTQAPKENSETRRPDLPRRRYSMVIPADLICRWDDLKLAGEAGAAMAASIVERRYIRRDGRAPRFRCCRRRRKWARAGSGAAPSLR